MHHYFMYHQEIKNLPATQWHSTFWRSIFCLWNDPFWLDVDFFPHTTLAHILKGLSLRPLNHFSTQNQRYPCLSRQHHPLHHKKRWQTWLFITVCSTVVSGVFFQAADAHSASFDACVLSRFFLKKSQKVFRPSLHGGRQCPLFGWQQW